MVQDQTPGGGSSKTGYGVYTLAILAVGLGGGSLALFAYFLSFGPLNLVDLGLGPAGSLGFDAFLSLLFFAVHSGLLRKSAKERLKPFLREEYQPALYALVSGVFILLLVALWQQSGPAFRISGVPRLLLRSALALSLAGFAWAGRALTSLDTFGFRSALGFLRGEKTQPGPLVVRGPYLWVRHPLYSFTLIMIWSYPDISPDRLLFNLLWSVWIVLGAFLEERDLLRLFGKEYGRYRSQTSMLLPTRVRPASGKYGR